MTDSIELHFQEGFAGQAVEVTVDGAPAADFIARTRLQTGLAHIATITAPPGATVAVSIKADGATAKFKAVVGEGHVRINREDKKLTVQAGVQSPGYM